MKIPKGTLTCPACPTRVPDTSKERGRFLRRHPSLCEEFRKKYIEGQKIAKELSAGTKAVDFDERLSQ